VTIEIVINPLILTIIFFSSYLKVEVRFLEMGALKPHNNFKHKYLFFHQAQKYPKVINDVFIGIKKRKHA
jgi:hypothetical protein